MNTELTPRESEVVRMVAHGNTNKQIAIALGISVNTVKTHLKKVCYKLQFRSRVQIAYWVARNSLDTEMLIPKAT